MSYTITTAKRFKDIPEGTTADTVERGGQTLYRFELDSDYGDYLNLSWDYIRRNKEYFTITKPS